MKLPEANRDNIAFIFQFFSKLGNLKKKGVNITVFIFKALSIHQHTIYFPVKIISQLRLVILIEISNFSFLFWKEQDDPGQHQHSADTQLVLD